MWKQLVRDRTFLLMALVAGLTWLLGRHTLAPGQALQLVLHGGYWLMLTAFVAWIWTLVRLGRAEGWRGPRTGRDWLVVGLIVAGGLVWQAHEDHQHKILADEVLLSGTAQNLHLDRQAGYGVRATNVQGPFQILESVLDKRPLFFPFLVSLLHDLSGYRIENAFWLNTALGFLFLGMLYLLAVKAGGGARMAGVFAVLCAIGLPLLAQQSAGGGFELLNLTLLAAWWWMAVRLLERPGPETQNVFVLTAVLLANTRYESALYLLPTAVLLLLSWLRAGAVRFTWMSAFAPLLVLPVLWLNRIFSARPEFWETGARGAGEVFSLSYVPDNLGHALKFFLSFSGQEPNSPWVGVLGLLAAPFFLLWAQRVWRAPLRSRPDEVGLAFAALGLLGGVGLLLAYFWGQIDDPVIRRLGLPWHLGFIIASVIVAGRVLKVDARVWRGLCAGSVLSLFVFSLPVMVRNAYGHDYSPAVAHAIRRDFVVAHPERDYLVLDRDALYWITERISATPIAQAKLRRDGIAYHLRNRSFSAVYAVQHFEIEPETGELRLEDADDLGPEFVLERMEERKTSLLQMLRVSRVREIRDGEKVLARDEPEPRVVEQELSAEEAAEARTRYLERWIKELP